MHDSMSVIQALGKQEPGDFRLLLPLKRMYVEVGEGGRIVSQHSISSLADSGTHYRVSWPVGSIDRGPHAIVPVLVTGKRDTRPSDTSGRTLYPALGSVASIPDMTAGRKVLLKDSAVRMDFNLFAVTQKWIGEAVKSLCGAGLLAVGMGRGQIQEVYRGRPCKELVSPELLVL